MNAAVVTLVIVVVLACAAAARPRPLARTPARAQRAGETVGDRTASRHRLSGRRRRRERIIDSVYPDALDLFVITVQAGYTPREAVDSVREVAHPLIGDVFQRVQQRAARGERFADALTSVTDALGPRGAAFVDTLTMTERAGLPIAPAVERLADDARQHRRRLAESAARQLPVRLSFPLVLCTLSSFVLVAIVPLLLGALTSFDGSSP